LPIDSGATEEMRAEVSAGPVGAVQAHDARPPEKGRQSFHIVRPCPELSQSPPEVEDGARVEAAFAVAQERRTRKWALMVWPAVSTVDQARWRGDD